MSTSSIRPGGRKLPARRAARGGNQATTSGSVPTGGSSGPAQLVRIPPQTEVMQVDDLERRRAALRAHVEQALAGFFGPRLVLEPRVQDIVSQTVEALLAEPALEGSVQAACRISMGDVPKE
jgi:hypothetical protein